MLTSRIAWDCWKPAGEQSEEPICMFRNTSLQLFFCCFLGFTKIIKIKNHFIMQVRVDVYLTLQCLQKGAFKRPPSVLLAIINHSSPSLPSKGRQVVLLLLNETKR